jgi:hypothetical protein
MGDEPQRSGVEEAWECGREAHGHGCVRLPQHTEKHTAMGAFVYPNTLQHIEASTRPWVRSSTPTHCNTEKHTAMGAFVYPNTLQHIEASD